MKILHFVNGRCNPDTANGVEKTIYNLAVNQAELGHEVHIVGISSKPAIKIPNVTVLYFAPSNKPWKLPVGLFEKVQSIQPGIVHFHSMYIPANVLLGSKLRSVKIPYVVTPNGNCSSHLLKRRPHLKLPFKFFFERPFINKSLFVHSVGDTQAIKEYGVTVPIVVAPNGIDSQTIPSTPNSNPILSIRPEWAKRTIFSFIGRLDTEQKGLDLMLSGVAEATRKGIDIGLIDRAGLEISPEKAAKHGHAIRSKRLCPFCWTSLCGRKIRLPAFIRFLRTHFTLGGFVILGDRSSSLRETLLSYTTCESLWIYRPLCCWT